MPSYVAVSEQEVKLKAKRDVKRRITGVLPICGVVIVTTHLPGEDMAERST